MNALKRRRDEEAMDALDLIDLLLDRVDEQARRALDPSHPDPDANTEDQP